MKIVRRLRRAARIILIDEEGRTLDFHLSPTRSSKAAKRFLGKALRGLKHWEKPATLALLQKS